MSFLIYMNEFDFIICDLLYSIGITEKYVGFFYTSYAVYLAVHKPESLLLITKSLYPEVAEHYRTEWHNVERAIRSAAAVAWQLCPDRLSYLARHDLNRRPSNAQFISFLANHVRMTMGILFPEQLSDLLSANESYSGFSRR